MASEALANALGRRPNLSVRSLRLRGKVFPQCTWTSDRTVVPSTVAIGHDTSTSALQCVSLSCTMSESADKATPALDFTEASYASAARSAA